MKCYKDPIVVKICPVCGKEFVPAPDHVYKVTKSGAPVCSYHCMMDARRKRDARRKKKKSWEK